MKALKDCEFEVEIISTEGFGFFGTSVILTIFN